MKKIQVKVPKYENVMTGYELIEKWETSDGEQFEDKKSAEYHEFYNCKIKQRTPNLSVGNVTLFDFTCKNDIERYERDYMYNHHVKKYDKNTMEFPNTYVMYEIDDPEWILNHNDDYGYDIPDTHVYFVTLNEYKKILIDEINKMK